MQCTADDESSQCIVYRSSFSLSLLGTVLRSSHTINTTQVTRQTVRCIASNTTRQFKATHGRQLLRALRFSGNGFALAARYSLFAIRYSLFAASATRHATLKAWSMSARCLTSATVACAPVSCASSANAKPNAKLKLNFAAHSALAPLHLARGARVRVDVALAAHTQQTQLCEACVADATRCLCCYCQLLLR